MATPSPLLQAVSSLTPDKGFSNQFHANITQEWTTQHSVLGGFLNALMLSATKQFLAQTHGEAQFPDPIHVFVQFLKMVPPGPVTISCTPLRVSSRQCVLRVELSQNVAPGATVPSPKSPNAPAAVSIVTFADISKESGFSLQPKSAGPAPLPNRTTECATIDDPVVDATPVTSKLNWVAPRAPGGFWGHRLGGHSREVWVSFRDGSQIESMLHLALLADLPLQPPATHREGFYLRHALSTLCLSVEFKKRPDPATKWVLIRSNSNKVVNGRYDANIQIFDEHEDLLALSNHVLKIAELRPQTRKAKM